MFLTVLPRLTEDQPKNRLGLAHWLVDDRNPLVARVIVNRAWMKFFGRGLVDAPDNFGVQGTPPSHPELLDWLADDFRSHGWNLKRLHRQIVLSATYQQASETSQQQLELDRENRWLSRGPRYRLSAEQIRDGALLISGLLNKHLAALPSFPISPMDYGTNWRVVLTTVPINYPADTISIEEAYTPTANGRSHIQRLLPLTLRVGKSVKSNERRRTLRYRHWHFSMTQPMSKQQRSLRSES